VVIIFYIIYLRLRGFYALKTYQIL